MMKKITRFYSLLSVLLLCSLCLTSCRATEHPRPEVEEGEFDVSVTYEANGEIKTLDLVYVCEYDGVKLTVEGSRYRVWDGHFEGYRDGAVIDVCNTEAGGKIVLCFLIYPEYFMGEPDYIDDFYPEVMLEHIYYEDGIEMISNDQEVIAEEYGVKIIGFQYDAPIENKFE